jgi:purine-nucleoside phosphorylase
MTSTFADLVYGCRKRPPRVGLILGSGLSGVTDALPLLQAVAFAELPGMPSSGVAGHRGRLCLHEYEHGTLLAFQGRLHFYEGHPWALVERPVHLAHELGVRTLVLTNASGGIGAAQEAGSLLAIRDHLAAMTPWWWRTERQPSPYSPRLLDLIEPEIPRGVYACVTGPNYETPAEIRALKSLGADAIGMSTVHEANVAAGLGMEVAGISCVANRAAGMSPTPLSHAEVLAAVQAAAGKMSKILRAMLLHLAD